MKERRIRIKKPITLKVISFILIASPIYTILTQMYFRNIPIHFSNVFKMQFTVLELSLILLPCICGVGLYIVKKWGWYLFLIYSSILISYNLYAVIQRPILYNYYSIFESFLFFLAITYLLKKDISAPYMKMFPRGWRGERRRPIQIQIQIGSISRTTKDLSENGFYVEWKDCDLDLNSEVEIRIPLEGNQNIFNGGIVRIDEYGVGIAFRNKSNEQETLLNSIITNSM